MNTNLLIQSRIAYVCFSLSVALLVTGCSSEESRYHISGTVTYKGNPLPDGYITFEPDNSKGASGGPGRTKITNGKYDTRNADSVGTLGGPHVVRIDGFDSKTTKGGGGEIPTPTMLFTGFTSKEDLPKENTTKDFNVTK